jgi:acetylglutamate kinase
VGAARVIDGRIPHSVLVEMSTDDGAAMVTVPDPDPDPDPDEAEALR